MKFNQNSNLSRSFIVAASFIIISLILWNTYTFFQIFKNEERVKMEFWAEAQNGRHTDLFFPIFYRLLLLCSIYKHHIALAAEQRAPSFPRPAFP